MKDSENSKSEAEKSKVLEYWQKIFDDLKEWHNVADSRANGIISINAMLLGFVTISAFVSFDASKTEIPKDMLETILLVGFFVSVMCSVILAIYSLWGRKKFDLEFWQKRTRYKRFRKVLSLLQKKNQYIGNKKDEVNNEVFLYFGDFLPKYTAYEDNKKDIGDEFSKKELHKYTSIDNVLKAISTQIVILSSDTYDRFWILNFSYILIVLSIILMSSFTFVRWFI